MTENEREDILVKVKKLLSLSKKNSNENEAAAAAAKAQELLLRYNLEMSEVEGVEVGKKDEPFITDYTTSHRAGNGASVNEVRWKILLAFGVAKANLCSVVHMGGQRKLCWLGKKSNIEIAQYIFDTLCVDLEYIADKRWKDLLALRKLQIQHPDIPLFTDESLRWVNGKTWKKSFYIGAVEVIRKRLTENLSSLRVDTNINALVVVNDDKLKVFTKETFGRLGKMGGSNGQMNWSGYAAGQEAGRNIQFKTGVGSGGSIGPKMIKG